MTVLTVLSGPAIQGTENVFKSNKKHKTRYNRELTVEEQYQHTSTNQHQDHKS